MGQGYLFQDGDKGLPLDGEETVIAHIAKWCFTKVKGETPCQDEVFSFNWAC